MQIDCSKHFKPRFASDGKYILHKRAVRALKVWDCKNALSEIYHFIYLVTSMFDNV